MGNGCCLAMTDVSLCLITELASSHVPMLSQRQRVCDVIREAAEAVREAALEDA